MSLASKRSATPHIIAAGVTFSAHELPGYSQTNPHHSRGPSYPQVTFIKDQPDYPLPAYNVDFRMGKMLLIKTIHLMLNNFQSNFTSILQFHPPKNLVKYSLHSSGQRKQDLRRMTYVYTGKGPRSQLMDYQLPSLLLQSRPTSVQIIFFSPVIEQPGLAAWPSQSCPWEALPLQSWKRQQEVAWLESCTLQFLERFFSPLGPGSAWSQKSVNYHHVVLLPQWDRQGVYSLPKSHGRFGLTVLPILLCEIK